MIRLLCLGLLGCSLLAAPAHANRPLTPQDFAAGLELRLGGREGLYRLQLPQEVYQGGVRADLADLRVFNGAGEAVPFQLQRPTAAQAEEWIPLPLFPLPAGSGAETSSLRVQIQRDAAGAVIEVRDQTAAAPGEHSGYLLDASALRLPLSALEVDWEETVETGASYRVRVEGSNDLQQWRPLGEATLLRLQYGGQELLRRRLEVPPTHERYLRLSAASGPAWRVTDVRARLAGAAEEPLRQWLSRPGTRLDQPRPEYLFDSGGHFPVDRLQLRLPQANTLVRVSLHSRNRENDPWQERARGLVYHLNREGTSLVSPELTTLPCGDRYWLVRLEQGELGQGSPELELGWQPHNLTFLARGQGPFLLAYGSGRVTGAASDGALLSQLATQTGGSSRPLPAQAGAERILAGAEALFARPPRNWSTWLLWGTLGLGVLLLAWMAWRLYRQLEGHQER